jgi:hypothetical protein
MVTYASTKWQATDPAAAHTLRDARLQLHYAAQFGTALGISFLPKEPDDSHTNLGWSGARGALMSRAVDGSRGPVSAGVLVADLAVLLTVDGGVAAAIPLDRTTIPAAADHLRHALTAAGLDRSRYALDRHYELPAHPVATGSEFDASDWSAFDQLARWYGNSVLELNRLASDEAGASEVRTWPHHFDTATLISHGEGRSNGVGFSPGDQYYDEPYFYANVSPQPDADRLTGSLAGDGSWHTRDWIGAVLPGSRVHGDATAQQSQVREFLDSALAACRTLAGA